MEKLRIGLVRNAAPIISPEETNALSVVLKNQLRNEGLRLAEKAPMELVPMT